MKFRFTFILSALMLLALGSWAKEVSQSEAKQVAKNFLYEKTGVRQSNITLKSSAFKKDGKNIYYIFNNTQGGFVLVSADDNYTPIFGYSLKNNFKEDGQPENLKWWLSKYVQSIEFVVEHNIKTEDATRWGHYLKSSRDFRAEVSPNRSIVVEPLLNGIAWNQDAPWNDLCPEDAAGPGGHVYAGCVAIAMGMIMKYWNYPAQGTSSHGYYATGYGMLNANYGETNYMWGYMSKTESNYYVAKLLYHLGVSVNMMYAADGSGAYSPSVPGAMRTYFGYDNSITIKSKSNYSNSDWITLLKSQLDADLPMYYGGVGDGGHAFVCDGYDTDNKFHYNFGWSGSSNGYYALNDVGGFSNNQRAIINFKPADTDAHPQAPKSLVAKIDTENLSGFNINLTWEAPTSSKAPTSYTIFRNDTIIKENVTNLTYTDENAPIANCYYGVKAVYEGGKTSLATPAELKSNFKISYIVKNGSGKKLKGKVVINGEEYKLKFGKIFMYVPFGHNYEYKVVPEGNSDEYPEFTDNIDVLFKDTLINVVIYPLSIDETNNQVAVYPNPSNGEVSLSGLQANNEIEVFDVNGKKVYSQIEVQNNSSINLTNLPSGTYFINVNNNGNTERHKIIIK